MTQEPELVRIQVKGFGYSLLTTEGIEAWERYYSQLLPRSLVVMLVPGTIATNLKQFLYKLAYGGVFYADISCLRPGCWMISNALGDGLGMEIYDVMYWRGADDVIRGFEVVRTPELQDLLDTTCSCGYCGARTRLVPGDPWHCTKCLGSPHLRPENLYLLRLQHLGDNASRPLTEAEYAELLPKYEEAQARARQEWVDAEPVRRARFVAKLAEDHRAAVKAADTEYEGKMWMVKHGFSIADIDNSIYYGHEDRWRLGWKTPVTEEKAEELRKAMSGFPGTYEITKKG